MFSRPQLARRFPIVPVDSSAAKIPDVTFSKILIFAHNKFYADLHQDSWLGDAICSEAATISEVVERPLPGATIALAMPASSCCSSSEGKLK